MRASPGALIRDRLKAVAGSKRVTSQLTACHVLIAHADRGTGCLMGHLEPFFFGQTCSDSNRIATTDTCEAQPASAWAVAQILGRR
jgi:hypothetical protein